MRWRGRGDWPERAPRPKVRKLDAFEKDNFSKSIVKAIAASPILSYFRVDTRLLRGRFYIEWQWNPEDSDAETTTWGRITPIDDEKEAAAVRQANTPANRALVLFSAELAGQDITDPTIKAAVFQRAKEIFKSQL